MSIILADNSAYKEYENKELRDFTTKAFIDELERLEGESIIWSDIPSLMLDYETFVYNIYEDDARDFVKCFYDELGYIYSNLKYEYGDVPNPFDNVQKFQVMVLGYEFLNILETLKYSMLHSLEYMFNKEYYFDSENKYMSFVKDYLDNKEIEITPSLIEFAKYDLLNYSLTDSEIDYHLKNISDVFINAYKENHMEDIK